MARSSDMHACTLTMHPRPTPSPSLLHATPPCDGSNPIPTSARIPSKVDNTLRDLEERFRINHREGLADALRDRLNALRQHPAKWHPEALYLLLELSDQPTLKARLSDLEALRQEEEQEEAPLRWEDIAREDGWDQDANMWKSIS